MNRMEPNPYFSSPYEFRIYKMRCDIFFRFGLFTSLSLSPIRTSRLPRCHPMLICMNRFGYLHHHWVWVVWNECTFNACYWVDAVLRVEYISRKYITTTKAIWHQSKWSWTERKRTISISDRIKIAKLCAERVRHLEKNCTRAHDICIDYNVVCARTQNEFVFAIDVELISYAVSLCRFGAIGRPVHCWCRCQYYTAHCQSLLAE